MSAYVVVSTPAPSRSLLVGAAAMVGRLVLEPKTCSASSHMPVNQLTNEPIKMLLFVSFNQMTKSFSRLTVAETLHYFLNKKVSE